MIVRNEEQNLAVCLAPVVALFDQVVIVDTGSKDGTCELARQFTSEVYHFAWQDDFAAARNEGLRHCRGDWIFWLDADDRLRPDQVEKLRGLLDGLQDRPAAYLMDTVCPARFACEGARLVTHARLFRRHPDMHWKGRVHEQLRPEPLALGYDVVWSGIQIDHLGYLDAGVRQRKLQRDVRLLRMDYAVDPEDTSTLLHLGLAYGELGQFAEARKYLHRLLRTDQEPAEYLRRVYGVLGELALREGQPLEALQVLDRGLLNFPSDQSLLFLRAEALYEVDQFDAARQALVQITSAPQSPQQHGGVPTDIKRKLAPRKLADVLRVQGAHQEAVAVLSKVVSEFPDDTHSWYLLGRVYIDVKHRANLEALLPHLKSCPQGSIFAGLLAASWHLIHNELDHAGTAIDRLISEAPNMPLPRLMRLDWLTRGNAPVEFRIGACRDLLRVQPGNREAAGVLERLEHAHRLEPAPRQPAAAQASPWGTSLVVGASVPAGASRA